MEILGKLSFPLTSNGKLEFLLRDQVSSVLVVYTVHYTLFFIRIYFIRISRLKFAKF